MKIAVLQFSPILGTVHENIAKADALLKEARAEGRLDGVQLLIGPEMAFTGYNHTPSTLRSHLEPTADGPSTQWARRWARALNALVSIGYPERTVLSPNAIRTGDHLLEPPPPGSSPAETPGPPGRTFNALITLAPDGSTLAHARKHHLYYTDAPWARPGAGFTSADLPLAPPFPAPNAVPSPPAADTAIRAGAARAPPGATRAAFGICMDLSPRFFRAPWAAHELAAHALAADARLLLVATAWMEADAAPSLGSAVSGAEASGKDEPDAKTIVYWISRLTPLITAPHRTLVVIANRTGVEAGEVRACDLQRERDPERVFEVARRESRDGVRGDDGVVVANGDRYVGEEERGGLVATEARYVGSSCVLVLGGGRAVCLGAMGRGEEGVGVVDVGAGKAEEMKMRGMTWVVREPGEREENG